MGLSPVIFYKLNVNYKALMFILISNLIFYIGYKCANIFKSNGKSNKKYITLINLVFL